MAEETAYATFIREQARKLRSADTTATTRDEWEKRRISLRERMFAAMGPMPTEPCDLATRAIGTLDRDGYRVEKLVFQTRPDVWVTTSCYVPAMKDGQKAPAVLVVHGHWAGARRDPVVQARCLGLVKLGFVVLAVDAFGAGERFTNPARGTYHGSLYGATLWPSGHSLLGMQVYDNRRAVDYLRSRKDVNGKFGVTGASGGGNQTMYAGALDERFQAVVPVCSVGNYQSYLRVACCVCEVLPGALQFTEEGDVLGLVAPRGLLVMNAAKDAIQFSPAEAEKSVARATEVFKLYDRGANVRHVVFDSGHDYNQAMREAMYGWMTLHLKGEGKGEPIPEPAHVLDKPEDLACFPNPADRPKDFLTPPLFAARVGREMVATANKLAPTHPEMWEATALNSRASLARLLGANAAIAKPATSMGVGVGSGELETQRYTIRAEEGMALAATVQSKRQNAKSPAALVLHIDGEDAARKHAVVATLLKAGYAILTADLRGTGAGKAKADAIAGAPDHNSAEHGLWVGRPLLAQWTHDARVLLAFLRERAAGNGRDLIVGIGPAGVIALAAAALSPERPQSVGLIDMPVSYVTDAPYASGTPMGLLVPGILKVGDIPHIAGMIAPRRLIVAGGASPQGKKLNQKELEEAFTFTSGVYQATKSDNLSIVADPNWDKIDW